MTNKIKYGKINLEVNMIIDIEGTDGSGKKTQTEKLFSKLTEAGYKCKLISFPNYESDSSAPVRMYLGGKLGDRANCLNAYQASATFAVDRLITMKLAGIDDYDFVLFDRYVPSNMIHQATKVDGKELKKFIKWVKDFEYKKLNLPRPDKILFLDMPVEASIKLARARGELKNKQSKDIHEADSEHLKLAYKRAKQVSKMDNWIRIDCVSGDNIKSIEEIHQEILTKLGLLDKIKL